MGNLCSHEDPAPPSPQNCGIEVIPKSGRFFLPFPLPARGQVINIPIEINMFFAPIPNPTDPLDVSQHLHITLQEKTLFLA